MVLLQYRKPLHVVAFIILGKKTKAAQHVFVNMRETIFVQNK